MKRALITGATGQDGHYLARHLQKLGYEVHGYVRRGNAGVPANVIEHIGDLLDPSALRRAVVECSPDEVYCLGAQSHVGASFLDPTYSMRATYEPLLTILEQLRESKRDAKVYQASSSEMFGDASPPQNEDTPLRPRSPYAIAKVAAHTLIKLYREAYGMFAVGGILFNHESPIRPAAFVTRKISLGVARIAAGQASELCLGNLDAYRDWGFAGDYVVAMHKMLQQDVPKDYVIATGESYSVRDFVHFAFTAAAELTGKGELNDWGVFVRSDDRHRRPAEVPYLCGDATRAREDLGWEPSVKLPALVKMMVASDLEAVTSGVRTTSSASARS
jgi:GDPmannose 4,6-dehydratase